MTNGLTATQKFKNQYNDLMMHTFGFSLEKWHNKGVWDDSYECYTIVENDVMIANVSVYKMKLLINGIERDCMQIGGVATRKEHRGKGLSRSIMEHIFNIYPDTLSFLFANDNVLEFYPKFGYIPASETQSYIQYKLKNKGEMVKLENTDSRIDYYLKNRGQFSQIVDCTNQYSINWFYMISIYPNNIYEIPELNVLMIAEQKGSVLLIHDVITKNPIDFSQLAPHLHFSGVDTIEFGFNPEWLIGSSNKRNYKLEDSTLFIKGDFGIEGDYMIPTTVRV